MRFDEIHTEHTAEILASLRAQDYARAGQQFNQLINTLTDVKVFEVHMLREKLLKEAKS